MHINKISNVKSLMLSPVFDSFAMSKYILSMGFPAWGITLKTGSTLTWIRAYLTVQFCRVKTKLSSNYLTIK